MDVNSTSSYVNKASSNKGFSGLASGVDTESMVEQMLSGTQSKIDKQNALKQQIEWKQEIYRDIISQINTFQNKFFSYSSDTNLLSESYFNAMVASATSKAFKVAATSSAAAGITSMEVRRLASNTSITSGAGVSGKLAGTLDASALAKEAQKQLGEEGSYTVKFQVGNKTVEADLRDIFVDGNTLKDYTDKSAELDQAIQERLSSAFKDAGVETASVTVKNGSVSIVNKGAGEKDAAETVIVSGDSGDLALKRLGLSAGGRSTASRDNKSSTLSGKVNETPAMTFSVTLDDNKKDVQLDVRKFMDADGNVNIEDFKNALQEGLDAAHGKGQVKVVSNGDSFELTVSGGRKVAVSSSNKAILDAMGLQNNQSNRINRAGSLKDAYFATPLQGSRFEFTINGERFSFTENDDIGDIMTAINSSDAGVRLVYRAQSDTFTLEATESGAGRTIKISQEEGNLLNALFGAGVDSGWASGKKAGSTALSGLVSGKTTLKTLGLTGLLGEDGNKLDENTTLDELKEKTGGLLFYENGTIVFSGEKESSKVGDSEILTKLFGSDKINGRTTSGSLSIEVTGDTTLGDLGLKLYDKDGNELADTTKLSELSDKTGGALSFEDGQIVADADKGFANSMIQDADTARNLFGVEQLSLGEVPAGGAKAEMVAGQNALIKVDGVLTERSSNAFDLNGLNITLKALTGSYEDVSGGLYANGSLITLEAGDYVQNGTLYGADGSIKQTGVVYQGDDGVSITADDFSVSADGKLQRFNGTADEIDVSRDTDKVVDGIKQFIDEYNKLVQTLNTYLDEDASYRDYAPLTDAQKKEMSEREIELWEEKAKEGLLRRDTTIETFLREMRTAMYEKPAGNRFALYDIGIETGEWQTKGQLVLSADGEAKLRQAIESDSASVMRLFADPDEGLAVKLNNIVKDTANTSSGSPGSLVQLAGIKGKASEKNNTLYNQLKAIEDKITALKKTYETEKQRYWNQFNTMEQMISNMNTQSSYLMQMMGLS